MKPHKTVILIRMKTHELNSNGECVPPATDDTGNLLFEINGLTKNDMENKKQEFLQKVKEWLNQ
jgi:hypothetical protein